MEEAMMLFLGQENLYIITDCVCPLLSCTNWL